MDNSGATPAAVFSDVLSHSGRGRDAIALSSIRFSDERRPSFAATHRSNDRASNGCRYRPATIRDLRTPPPSMRSSISGSSHSNTESTATSYITRSSCIPDWKHDFDDLEAGCDPWSELPSRIPSWRWLWARIFRSKVEYKIRSPESCRDIGYNISPRFPVLRLAIWLLICTVYQLALPFALRMFGWDCAAISDTFGSDQSTTRYLILWAAAVVGAGAAFLIGQGYFGLRATRERMERVRQTIVTLAYSFLKTTKVDEGRYSQGKMQQYIYQCLALLTAFPVALLHQVQGNTCEPAVTKYCHEVARELKRLRSGETDMGWTPFHTNQAAITGSHCHRQYRKVEHFFELFSLQLEAEFSQRRAKTCSPSIVPQYIIYNMRNHFENIVDAGNLDLQRTPIIRENIDMLALAGRECAVYAGGDVVPTCMLWTIDVCCRGLAALVPMRRCDWIVDTTKTEGGITLSWRIVWTVVMCTGIMMLLGEMWSLWDPFGKSVNTFSWSLGIASEIDNMLNEFYEYDVNLLTRKHGYMQPSKQLNRPVGRDCDCDSD